MFKLNEKYTLAKDIRFVKTYLKSYCSNATDVITVLLLSPFDMTLVCTSVVLLCIPLAKCHNKQKFKAQHSTLSNNFWGIL